MSEKLIFDSRRNKLQQSKIHQPEVAAPNNWRMPKAEMKTHKTDSERSESSELLKVSEIEEYSFQIAC